ncbi:S-layer homology domain-containing protein, partial [Candidatus Peregrinibacteria bacterium]|nr:S-layer homology domain-containing protein [Candidatus Peregrinibacteria bacterium]
GYPDGTFKPNQVINRAETAKVILEALNYTIYENPGHNFGYSDLNTSGWYMKYIFTSFAKQIMKGYPDMSMKAEQTVNRAEMLKMFLKATGSSLSSCDATPYPDVTADAWYCTYAKFAQLNNLVDTDSSGNLNPIKGMTRGDVAELFYRYNTAFGL